MWCSACQQDVPALGSAAEGTLCCGKCSGPLKAEAKEAQYEVPAPTLAVVTRQTATVERLLRSSSLSNEDWLMEAELRGVERLLSALKMHSRRGPDATKPSVPHIRPASWDKLRAVRTAELCRPTAKAPPRGHAIAWTILSIALAVFASGSVLLGWSLIARRDDLWPIGMPLALIGQAGLILGLVLHLDGLWSSNRQTAEALSELDEKLTNVREGTALLPMPQAGGPHEDQILSQPMKAA